MIKIESSNPVGWEEAIRGMRNPMNSWDMSDSGVDQNEFVIGKDDMKLMLKLAKAGPVHAKYRRMITVYADIVAPLYWWKEFDTYKVGTVANSCSTMHKIHSKEFSIDDFSHEHLTSEAVDKILIPTIDSLNNYRDLYLFTLEQQKAYENCSRTSDAKKLEFVNLLKLYWWQMIQLLPSSYNQRRTVMLSYEVLAGMREYRHMHKLDEWRHFCIWIDELPNSEIIIGGDM